MFKVGDLVRSIKDSGGNEYYSLTKSSEVCRVEELRSDGFMQVSAEGYISLFWVMQDRFVLETIDLENK